MVKKATNKDFLREIRKTLSRFISIVLLLMLSIAFFSGLRATQPDMYATADAYLDEHRMYDIRIQSTLGMTAEDVDAIRRVDGVQQAAGFYSFDAVASSPKQDIVVSMEALGDSGMNTPDLLGGRLPASAGECAVEQRFVLQTGLNMGDSFSIKEVAPGFDGAFSDRTLKIVGLVRSPLYISKAQRGSSTLGSGNIAAYVILPADAVKLDYFTEVDILVAGASDKTAFTDAYKNTVKTVKDHLEALGKTQAPARYDALVSKAESDIQSARTKLDEKKTELEDAKKQLADAQNDYDEGRRQLDAQKAQADSALADARKKLDDAAAAIAQGTRDLENSKKQLDAAKADGAAQLAAAQDELDTKQSLLGIAYNAYQTAKASYDAQRAQWDALPASARAAMPEQGKMLEEAGQQLTAQKQQLDGQQAALTAASGQLAGKKAALEQQSAAAQRQLDDGQAALETSKQQLSEGRQEYDRQKTDADKKLSDAEAKLSDAAEKIANSRQQLKDGDAQISQGEKDLQDADKKVADIQQGKWYVGDRSANIGYDNYGEDADRMGALSNVFPLIFFAVAALVALTTMTRMVDDKRVEIGTYKALGHSRMTTSGKFIYYSLAATVIGVAGGLPAGTLLLPRFIFKAYSILYDLPPLQTPFHPDLVLISSAAALVTTVGATIAATAAALRETPASLLRPKAPQPGKRVFLEHITPFWRRLSFFAKVSLRNIFRYKKRLVMTLLGIAGCTALIVTGFGLRDSINDIADIQFGKINKYNLVVFLGEGAGSENAAKALQECGEVSDYIFDDSVSADFGSGTGTAGGHVIVPADTGRFGEFVRLAHRSDGKPVTLTDDGAVITEKMSELLHLRIGDTFTIDANGKYTARVAEIVENYVYHYAYMTPAYYKTVFGKDAAANQALVSLKIDSDAVADQVSSELLKVGDISYVSHFYTVAKSFRDSMKSIDGVVLIILVSAGLLAFVVLYNLTNINITERTRELATIKVLGFYDREGSWYILRENTILTAAGILLGLVCGKFLHSWLVRTVELNFVMFGRSARPESYLYAAALTILFAAAVNILGQGRMRRINMIESLKTNE